MQQARQIVPQGGAAAKRSDAVARFDGEAGLRVFLLSLSAGAQGLTLNQGAFPCLASAADEGHTSPQSLVEAGRAGPVPCTGAAEERLPCARTLESRHS